MKVVVDVWIVCVCVQCAVRDALGRRVRSAVETESVDRWCSVSEIRTAARAPLGGKG